MTRRIASLRTGRRMYDEFLVKLHDAGFASGQCAASARPLRDEEKAKLLEEFENFSRSGHITDAVLEAVEEMLWRRREGIVP